MLSFTNSTAPLAASGPPPKINDTSAARSARTDAVPPKITANPGSLQPEGALRLEHQRAPESKDSAKSTLTDAGMVLLPGLINNIGDIARPGDFDPLFHRGESPLAGGIKRCGAPVPDAAHELIAHHAPAVKASGHPLAIEP